MSIVINSEDQNNISQLFNLEKDWLIGKTILLNNNDSDLLNHIFDFNETKDNDDHSRSDQVERIHTLSQQLIQRPNRTCLSDIYNTFDSSIGNAKKVLSRIIPSHNTLFELAQPKPDNSRWTLTFQQDEEEQASLSEEDDGFQSASSSLSEDKSKLALVPIDDFDYWSRALKQTENKYFTWEQRGSYIYDRTRPFLFDLRTNPRPFQHLCLLLLFKKPSLSYSLDINYHPISIEEYLRDLSYMLMSISSHTFQWNEAQQTFELKPDIYILGYTQIVIEQFSMKYIQYGNKFHFIKHYINQSSLNCQTESELCQSLRFYLRYIEKSIVIHDIEKYSLIKFSSKIDPILDSLDLPVSLISTINELEDTIHKSSPTTSEAFVKLSSILHTLLNHNYYQINSNYFQLLLHFITYTIQPLLLFLTNLIIYSNYIDRYNEYPILFNYNRLIGLKTNDFWTKTFTIRYLHSNNSDTIFHQILPIDYLQKIVNITRSLMLIKLCDKNHPLALITTQTKPQLKFIYINSKENMSQYENEMKEEIFQYEQLQKQKRLDIEQAKVQERMDMYARQDQQRAQRQKLLDDERQRILTGKQKLRDEWQEQADAKQRQVKEEKLAELNAAKEFNDPTTLKTIIGSRLATPYANLVENVREEIIAEYDAKMRDATEREEQFRQRIHPNANPDPDTPKDTQPPTSTVSSASSPSFHTPAIDQSPAIIPTIETKSSITIEKTNPEQTERVEIVSIEQPKQEIQTTSRRRVNEQTTEPEYRPAIRLVPSNALKSTIQNYLIDHNPLDDSQDEEELPEIIYDWDAIISNGPQFKYEDTFDFNIKETEKENQLSNESWLDYDLSPLRVWLEHSISSLIHVQSQLVNRALLNYFFDELELLTHLNNLRAYYFLATGRFGLAFSSELSRILLTNDDVKVIYHVNTMRQILYTSLDQDGELNHLLDVIQLTSKMNIPNSISLLDPTLLDYFELNYTIQWPLNIIISQEILEKYKIIFRFLLRILIVKQVLNEIWVMLKSCKQQNATLSQLHQYRHQMQHFMTVFINYITNQVIQIAWNEFMRKIQKAKHINEIVIAHNEYLDRTMLNCLLTPNAAPILNEVNRVLTLIIRFRCQLKTFSWILEATYTDVSDTSIQALRTTFEKYHIAVLSLFKVLSKLVEKGYKTSLADLLIRLNHNGYYDRIATSSIRRH